MTSPTAPTPAPEMRERRALHVDVFADVTCPWCWIGERRLRRILAEYDDLDVTANWRPFQLNPKAPPDGESWAAVIETKFGGYEQAREGWTHVQEAATTEGLEFRFDLITRFPNTRRAHELVLYASSVGRTWAAVDALFAAYFREGLDVGDMETLLEIGRGLGLETAVLAALFSDGRYADDVMESQRDAASIGINGVPLFILNGRYGVSGAQPDELFRRAIAQAAV